MRSQSLVSKDSSYINPFGETFIVRKFKYYVSNISFYSAPWQTSLGEAFFTVSEQYGYSVFKANCNACHTEPLFTNKLFANNGLSVTPALIDFGRIKVTGNKDDSLKFKVPNLRNVQLTAPHMHDGRLFTLSQVLTHYTGKMDITPPTLHPLLQHTIVITN